MSPLRAADLNACNVRWYVWSSTKVWAPGVLVATLLAGVDSRMAGKMCMRIVHPMADCKDDIQKVAKYATLSEKGHGRPGGRCQGMRWGRHIKTFAML